MAFGNVQKDCAKINATCQAGQIMCINLSTDGWTWSPGTVQDQKPIPKISNRILKKQTSSGQYVALAKRDDGAPDGD